MKALHLKKEVLRKLRDQIFQNLCPACLTSGFNEVLYCMSCGLKNQEFRDFEHLNTQECNAGHPEFRALLDENPSLMFCPYCGACLCPMVWRLRLSPVNEGFANCELLQDGVRIALFYSAIDRYLDFIGKTMQLVFKPSKLDFEGLFENVLSAPGMSKSNRAMLLRVKSEFVLIEENSDLVSDYAMYVYGGSREARDLLRQISRDCGGRLREVLLNQANTFFGTKPQ